MFNKAIDQVTKAEYSIPGDLFGSYSVINVDVNGVTNNYTVYLFKYGTETNSDWEFKN
jgi:hypothetical protein